MVAFIDAHRDEHGVEPICEVLPIAPSTYYEHKARQADRSRLPARERQDVVDRGHVRRVWQDSGGRYGVRKVWKQLHRENIGLAKCTVRRLMRQMGLHGVTRSRRFATTTISDPSATRPPDLVDRQFVADHPNQLWISDITYVWTARRFVYTAFVFDVFSRRIVGWRTTDHLRTDLVLDALDQAVYDRLTGPDGDRQLIAHSDAGTQYTAMRYTDRLAEAGIAPSIGSVGDSFDNAMAESIIGLYKAEVIYRRDRWDSLEQVEWETMRWVAWFNHDRIYEALGDIPPAEFEDNHYRQDAPTELAGAT
jgi:putative transposase